MNNKNTMKLAKKYIHSKPMPSSLEKEFKKNGLESLLEKVYIRTAELIEENQDVSEAKMAHLKQILPSIAFYEALLEKERNQEQALAVYEKWCFLKIEKMAKISNYCWWSCCFTLRNSRRSSFTCTFIW